MIFNKNFFKIYYCFLSFMTLKKVILLYENIKKNRKLELSTAFTEAGPPPFHVFM